VPLSELQTLLAGHSEHWLQGLSGRSAELSKDIDALQAALEGGDEDAIKRSTAALDRGVKGWESTVDNVLDVCL